MKTSSEPFIGFKDQDGLIRLKQRILNRSRGGDKAVPSAIWEVDDLTRTTTASGGGIQQAERAPDQCLASF
jgi:hypothetical protein